MTKPLVAPLCALTVLAGAVLVPVQHHTAFADSSISGAGSTFDFPYFDKAFSVYKKQHGVAVNYQPVGSGAGITLFTQKVVDFGATDVPLNPASELPAAVKAGGAVEQIPIALGGVSVAYNVPGVKSGLKLDGGTLAKIYLGTIKNWNDAAIKHLNRGVHLPNLAITVVHRSDGSGTSYAFSDYLALKSAQWRGVGGVSKTPNWPTGIGGKGNLGVAQFVEQTSGAIGYVELAYVLLTHMKEARIKNHRGQYEYPTLKTVAADASSFKRVSATNFSISDGKGKNAYPISTYSWLLLFRHQSDSAKGKVLVNLTRFLVTTGQNYAKKLEYVPLPSGVRSLDLKELKLVR